MYILMYFFTQKRFQLQSKVVKGSFYPFDVIWKLFIYKQDEVNIYCYKISTELWIFTWNLPLKHSVYM